MSLKLLYFNIPGRAYVIRAALQIGKVQFEDNFMSFDEFKAAKPFNEQLPLGSLPVLTLPSGKVITQSVAIARYAGKLSGLYPENPEEALQVDEIIDITQSDISAGAPQHPDAEEKKKLREAWAEGKLKILFNHLNNKVVAAKGGFLVNNKRSIADLFLYVNLRSFANGGFDNVPRDYIDAWPALAEFVKFIEADEVFGNFKIPNK